VEVQEELLAFGILQRRGYKVEDRQNSIIEKLVGRTMDDAFVSDLAAAHNRRAARMR
jgi:hypothetical protein